MKSYNHVRKHICMNNSFLKFSSFEEFKTIDNNAFRLLSHNFCLSQQHVIFSDKDNGITPGKFSEKNENVKRHVAMTQHYQFSHDSKSRKPSNNIKINSEVNRCSNHTSVHVLVINFSRARHPLNVQCSPVILGGVVIFMLVSNTLPVI